MIKPLIPHRTLDTITGNVLSILAHTTSDPVPTTATPNIKPPLPKSAKAKPPQITSEMTHPQFGEFKIDWDIFLTKSLHNFTSVMTRYKTPPSIPSLMSFNKMNPLFWN